MSAAEGPAESLTVALPFRAPFDAAGLLGWLAARAVPGIEEVQGATYRRSLRLPRAPAVAELELAPAAVECRLWLGDPRDLAAAVQRCRRLLDLGADPVAVSAHLAGDGVLAGLVAQAPGLRVPGTVDGAELAVRAVLGQQVSLAAARTAAGRLAAAHGERLLRPRGAVTTLFPEAGVLAALDPAVLAMPATRARALIDLCGALAFEALRLDPGADREEARRRLLAVRGIGPWTAGYVAMRALGDPDVFLGEDLGVRAALARLGVTSDVARRSEAWRPWRSYATQHLWHSLASPG